MSQQKAQLVNPIGNITVPGGIIVSGATTAGNFIGSFSGTATGLSGTPNLNVGVVTATAFYGDGSSLTGVAGSTFVGQSTTSQSPTTTINLSLGNVIYFNHTVDTTVAFANTATTDSVTFIRTKDDSATARAITWPASVRWTGGSAPTLINSSQPNDAQIFNLLTRDSGATWYAHEEVSYSPPIPYQLWAIGGQAVYLGIPGSFNSSSPVQIPGNQWSSIDSGYTQSVALKNDGTLWAWGDNSNGQSASNDTVPRSSPIQVPGTQWSSSFKVNTYGVLAEKTDGTLWAWGSGTGGELGLNNVVPRSSPVQIPGTQWNVLSSGFQTQLATKTDGTLWAWGVSGQGTLGLNNAIDRSSPTQVPGTQWSSVSGSYYSILATKTDGTLWAWGTASRGELGINDRTIRSSPTQIPGTQWSTSSNHIATGGSSPSFAIKTNGTLWAWGGGSSISLGLNNTTYYSSPTQIPGTQWSSVDAGEIFSNSISALKTDGTLWAWGSNSGGRMGLNDVAPRSSPHQIPGTQWISHTNGGSFIFAIKQG